MCQNASNEIDGSINSAGKCSFYYIEQYFLKKKKKKRLLLDYGINEA